MDGIEQAIRRALAKGDAEDRAFRERVYRSAFAALDKSIRERRDLTVENAINKRKALKATIAGIETEYIPAAAPAAPVAPADGSLDNVSAGPPDEIEGVAMAPAVDIDGSDAPRRAEQARPASPQPRARRRGRREHKRRRWWPRALVTLVVLALIGVGGFFAFQAVRSADPDALIEQLTELAEDPASQPQLSSDDSDPDAGWTGLFSPEQIQRVQPVGSATAEAMEDEEAAYLRISSGGEEGAVRISVGQGVLEQFAGRTVVFALAARAASEDAASSIAVECDFAAMGDCGRTRFSVGNTPEDFLFMAELPDIAPGDGGAIVITTGLGGEGEDGVDVLALRARPAE